MNPTTKSRRGIADNNKKSEVITKAVTRSAEWLDINASSLSGIIGLSASSISRMKSGTFLISEGDKTYELSAYFIRAYRSLFSIVGGDQKTAREWITNDNRALGGIPLELMKTIRGLNAVCDYLDARRAII